MKKRLAVVTAGAAFLALLAGCASGAGTASEDADAETFPADTVKMIVSYAAGGPTDVAGRAIAAFMEKDLGVTFVVENREGASGAIGTAEVVNSSADGYTIGMTTSSAVGRVPLLQDVGYALEDVQAIGVGTYGPGLLIVRADSPYETFDDLVDAAEDNPASINIGTAGPGAPQHVEIVRMKQEYGVDFTLVPFQGEAPAITALLGENVDACFCSNAQTTMAQVDAGELRILASGSPERIASLPDVPTLAESGFEDLVHGNSYFILVAPAGVPDDVLEVLEGSLERALQDSATREVIGEVRLLDEFMGAQALQNMMEEEQVALGPILKELFAQ